MNNSSMQKPLTPTLEIGRQNQELARRRRIIKRRIGAVAVIIATGVAANVGFQTVKSWIKADTLVGQLGQPYPKVAAGLKDGKIDSSGVVPLEITKSEYPYTAAEGLGAGMEVTTATAIIQAQDGNLLQPGDQIVVPRSDFHPTEPAFHNAGLKEVSQVTSSVPR